MTSPSSERYVKRWPFALAGVALVMLLFARGMFRFFDLDEHQFVAPPVLLNRHGLQPYLDYPYFHLPNLIYLYASLLWATPYKLFAARMVSIACGTATVMLLFAVGWKLLADLDNRKRWLFAGGLTATYICCRIFTYTSGWAWNHDAAALIALSAYLLHLRLLQTGSDGAHFWVGLLCAVGAGIRLTVAPLAFAFAISLLWRPGIAWRRRLGSLAWFTLGGVVGSLPALMLFYAVSDRFWFGNLVYPALYGESAQAIEAARWDTTIHGKIAHVITAYVTDPGNLVIFAIAAFGLVRWARQRWNSGWSGAHRGSLLLLATAGALGIGVMAPPQFYYQYNYIVLPFLLIACFMTIAADARDPAAMQRWVRYAGTGIAIALLTGLPRWYWPVVNLPRPSSWVPIQVHNTGLWVAAQLKPGARVMTIDPLVPLEGGLDVYPEYVTGRFVFHVGRLMSPEDRRRFGVAWGPELAALLARRPPDAVLYAVRLEDLVLDMVGYAKAQQMLMRTSPDGAYRLWVRPAP